MTRRWISIGVACYVLLLMVVFPLVIGIPVGSTFASDAVGYSRGAMHLLKSGFYSFDGIQPFMDREPAMSVFLVPIYLLFGIESALGLYIVQAALVFVSAWALCHQLAGRIGERAAGLTFVLLLVSGGVLHSIFSAYREAFQISTLMLLCALFLYSEKRPTTIAAIGIGVLLAVSILTSYSFVLLPLFVAAVLLRQGWNWKQTGIVLLSCAIPVLAWGLRNYSHDGQLRVIDNRRTAVMWYVRGEQAEKVHGLEPLKCLWAEYISRDWTGRSPACSFNGLMNTRWPEAKIGNDYADVARAGQAKIRAHFGSYLWFSLFEILELHFPFVGGGWSRLHNFYAAFTITILYFGCLFSVRCLADRRLMIFVVIAAYNTLVFILTDATPRYLVPVLFCYAVFAGIGYDAVSRWITRKHG